MEISLCAIARLENKYIKEWVDYHLSLGFSHIYLYDNNREGEERICDIIDTENLYQGVVTIIPFHNVENWPQMQAYGDCWSRFKFDWILYIDLDEFFTFGSEWKGDKMIQSFVKKFENRTDAILLNWMCYGDNNQLKYEAKSLFLRFPKPLPLNFSINNLWGKQPINGHVKTCVRHTADFHLYGPHVGQGNYRCCNADGIPVCNQSWQPKQTYANAYIRHYVTKSISEYLDVKTKKCFADRAPGFYHDISSFFLYNKPTVLKIIQYRKNLKQRNQKGKPLFWWMKQWIKHWVVTPLFIK